MTVLMKVLKQIVQKLFVFFPIQNNKIVFDNFSGRGYGCNPKYIAEALIDANEKLDLVWICKEPENEKIPKEIRVVKSGTIKAIYEWATALVWVDNIRTLPKYTKRKKQFYIQTWHSSIGLKRIEAAASNLSEDYIEKAKYDGKITDLMFANNKIRFEQYQRDFWYDGKIVKCGVPRNSILFKDNSNLKNDFLKKLNISNEKKIILYAPTFRKKDDMSVYKFDYERVIQTFEEKNKNEYILLMRLHPNVAKESKKLNYNQEKVIDVSDYSDMQELLAISEILITDYSSCMFDAAFAYKPVLLFSKDIENYITCDQGFLLDYKSLPFSISENEDALYKNILEFNYEEYKTKCKAFFDSIDVVEDGNGAKVISDIILDYIKMKGIK